ncbi:Ulp1 protease family, carboxy-terminal domain protein [Sesbania bispinosa]|nr:Ulp1 protease family, carboxy-terminal domain protein [Sesbania bispinosa]
MQAPNLSVDMNAKNVNFGYREGILKEARATHTNTAVHHYCPSNATIKVLGDSIEKVIADLKELKKDVNNEFAQLKEVTKQILTKLGLFENSLPDKCQVKSTTNATGAPTSIDVNDSVHEDLSPKSVKNQTPPAANIKRKPISSTSQVNMTRRIEDIQTVELVSSDEEILPAKNSRKKDCSTKTMCTTKHSRVGGQVQEITSVMEKSNLQVGEGSSNAMKVVNKDLTEEDRPTKCTKPPYRLRSHSASKQPSSMVGGVGKILKFSSTPTKRPKKVAKTNNVTSVTQPTPDSETTPTTQLIGNNDEFLHNDTTNSNFMKPNGNTLPKGVICNFPPTPDMGLTKEEGQLCAYVFNPNMDPGYAEAIGGIIQAPRYKDFGLDIMKDVGAWEISDLKWPSTGARSNNSVVWVLSWLDMDYAFQPNITPVLDQNVVRMKIVMQLLLCTHNSHSVTLILKAHNYCLTSQQRSTILTK